MAPIMAVTFLFVTHSFSSIPFIDFLLVCLPFCLFQPLTFRDPGSFHPSPLLFVSVSLCCYFLISPYFSHREPCFAKTVKIHSFFCNQEVFLHASFGDSSENNQEAIYQTFCPGLQKIQSRLCLWCVRVSTHTKKE